MINQMKIKCFSINTKLLMSTETTLFLLLILLTLKCKNSHKNISGTLHTLFLEAKQPLLKGKYVGLFQGKLGYHFIIFVVGGIFTPNFSHYIRCRCARP